MKAIIYYEGRVEEYGKEETQEQGKVGNRFPESGKLACIYSTSFQVSLCLLAGYWLLIGCKLSAWHKRFLCIFFSFEI